MFRCYLVSNHCEEVKIVLGLCPIDEDKNEEEKMWKCKECGGKVKFERHYKDSLDENGFIIEEEREAEEIYRCQDCGEENYLIQLIADWKE